MSHSSGLGYDFLTPELLQYRQYMKDEDNPLTSLVSKHHHLPQIDLANNLYIRKCGHSYMNPAKVGSTHVGLTGPGKL